MTVKVWMVFEAVGKEKENVEQSLQDHIDAMETEDSIDIEEVEKDPAEEIENPHEAIDEGFSQVIELRADFESFKDALQAIVNYGPTYIQVEGPDRYEMNLKESQETLQEVANTMHQYAQMGAGGVLISKGSQDN